MCRNVEIPIKMLLRLPLCPCILGPCGGVEDDLLLHPSRAEMGSLVGLEMLHRTPATLGRADAKDFGGGTARYFAKYWIVWQGVVLVPDVGLTYPAAPNQAASGPRWQTYSLVLKMPKLHLKLVTNFLGPAVVVKVHLCDNLIDCIAMVAIHDNRMACQVFEKKSDNVLHSMQNVSARIICLQTSTRFLYIQGSIKKKTSVVCFSRSSSVSLSLNTSSMFSLNRVAI